MAHSQFLLEQSRRTRRYPKDHPDHQSAMSNVHLDRLRFTYPEWRPDRAGCHGDRSESRFLEMVGDCHTEGVGLLQ
jgi:hypothetical protein